MHDFIKVGSRVWWFRGRHKVKIEKSVVVKTTPKGCWLSTSAHARNPGTQINMKTSVWRTFGRVKETEREVVDLVLSVLWTSLPYRKYHRRRRSKAPSITFYGEE